MKSYLALYKQIKDLSWFNASKNPALTVGAITTGIISIVYWVLLWSGVKLETVETIFSTAALFLPVVASVLIRFKVWSPFTVKKVIEVAEEEIAKRANQTPSRPQSIEDESSVEDWDFKNNDSDGRIFGDGL